MLIGTQIDSAKRKTYGIPDNFRLQHSLASVTFTREIEVNIPKLLPLPQICIHSKAAYNLNYIERQQFANFNSSLRFWLGIKNIIQFYLKKIKPVLIII